MRDYKKEYEERVAFIRDLLEKSGAKGIVYGNSGGKDSALVGILCKAACDNTVGIIMPCASKRNFGGGLLRMLFPFSMGMLLSRNFKPIKVKGAFWICAIALVALFSVPYLEGATPVCTNGIYEAFCVIIAFPVLVWLGASGTTTYKKSTQICKFLGDISYPVYVIHYPFMYLFYAWLIKNQLFTLEQTWQVALCVYAWNILLAYLCL